ncbi:DUF2786 domain-containing protein [Vibrio sp. Sgm 5]|uniref:DUF2786 domain-containing protein n=1 Tax=Vibrio sp. Sgm 5 TaxID=2994387 RepID=UPI002248A536|nr:DUF2786 domain-containing protein [Vibrio sp. Sgm 5]MCX2788370.1 DUF2786 domain-containing protein [Vibrio sp. Sgm 5]
MSNKDIDRIKKLLRLAKSSNEHEAAAAMSRAQSLMKQHRLNSNSPELSDICEEFALSKFKSRNPANYFVALALKIGEAFGCHVYFRFDWVTSSYRVYFTGHNERPDVAKYAYEVLERQLVKSRKEYISTLNKRIKKSTKTARADLFCEGWVIGVKRLVEDFALTEDESTQLKEYVKAQHPDMSSKESRSASTKNARGGSHDAHWAGFQSGLEAELNRGVNGSEQRKLANV